VGIRTRGIVHRTLNDDSKSVKSMAQSLGINTYVGADPEELGFENISHGADSEESVQHHINEKRRNLVKA
jgi:hypothetical protein